MCALHYYEPNTTSTDKNGSKTGILWTTQYDKDLYEIIQRYQGLANKILESQQKWCTWIDLRSGLYLQKRIYWIWWRGSDRSRGLSKKSARHRRDAKHYMVLHGLSAKGEGASSSSVQSWAGRGNGERE
jgi:hypothetical protein